MSAHLSGPTHTIELPPLHLLAHLVSGRTPLSVLVDLSPEESLSLCRLAVTQGLAPMLYRQLQLESLLSELPRPVYETLLATYAQTAGYNFIAIEAAQQWTAYLEAEGIPTVWLKGLPLSLSIYPSPDTRPMVDIDVLVSQEQRDIALRLATNRSGHQPAMLNPDQAIHAIFPVGAGERVKMELHWSLIAPSTSHLAPDPHWFMHQLHHLETKNGTLTTLTPEAHLLYLSAHAELGHGESQFKLVRYLDLHRLVETYAPLDWAEIVQQASRFRWTYAVERALQMTQTYFGTPIPDKIPEELSAHRPVDENIALVEQRGLPGTKWERIQVRFQGEAGTGRVRLALALLFPPPAYIRWRYNVQGWRVPFYYPYRWIDVMREIARSR